MTSDHTRPDTRQWVRTTNTHQVPVGSKGRIVTTLTEISPDLLGGFHRSWLHLGNLSERRQSSNNAHDERCQSGCGVFQRPSPASPSRASEPTDPPAQEQSMPAETLQYHDEILPEDIAVCVVEELGEHSLEDGTDPFTVTLAALRASAPPTNWHCSIPGHTAHSSAGPGTAQRREYRAPHLGRSAAPGGLCSARFCSVDIGWVVEAVRRPLPKGVVVSPLWSRHPGSVAVRSVRHGRAGKNMEGGIACRCLLEVSQTRSVVDFDVRSGTARTLQVRL